MQRLILFLILSLPWWAYFPISGGIAWMGYEVYQSEQAEMLERHAQAKAPPPEIVDLSAFDRSQHVAQGDEVHVAGWINGDYNYELIKSTNGVRTGSRFMMVLFGTGDTEASTAPRAALIMTEADKDRFADMAFDFAVDYTDQGLVLGLNGFKGSGDGYSTMAYDAMRDEGLSPGPNFIFIEPFLDGREAALTATGEPIRAFGAFLLFAAAYAMIGVVKLVRKRKPAAAKPARDPFANGPIAGAGTAPVAPPLPHQQPGAVMADSVTDDTPLGRIKKRQQDQMAAALAASMPDQPAQAPEVGPPARTADKPRSALRFVPQVLAGLVVVIALSFMVPGVASIAGVALPIAMVAGIWFFIFKAGKKVEGGLSALRGVEQRTETVATVAGVNITRTKTVPRPGGSVLRGLFGGGNTVSRDRTRVTRDKLAADPFDKLAAQVRSGQ